MSRPPTAPPYIDWPLDGRKLLVMLALTVLLLTGAIYLRSREPQTPLPPQSLNVITPAINDESE